jgi:HD-GYP domain-containing protein (c-di-GMP phosphodiesterase class II)
MVRRKKGKTGPLGEAEETSQLYRILAHANQIASNTELDDLLSEMLDLIVLVCGANAGTLFLLDPMSNELIFKVIRGSGGNHNLLRQRIGADQGIAGATLQGGKAIIVEDLVNDPRWYGPVNESDAGLFSVISLPLLLPNKPIGVVQVFNHTHAPLQLIQLLSNRMASEIDKSVLLQASQRRGERLEALVSIIRGISTTLDQDQILTRIIESAHTLLNAEASSLFLLDEGTGELIMHISRDVHQTRLPALRIPAGEGIIGHVVKTGETVLVSEADADERHYPAIDDISGLDTHSLLAVPLRTSKVVLGQERGTTDEQIIGGLEAMNKVEGSFTPEDARLLETLAEQAATVLHIARLYADANELFLDTIKALVATIDAKDPYTEGHSQRVSDFSAAMARELEMPTETIHHITIGGLLHDVGKIGVPDAILSKPARLTDDEYEQMKEHPSIGANIMGQVRMLNEEIPALEQHHERLDGNGYPNGLRDVDISLFGRIVAVADVFDAMTSDRPYRDAISVEDSLEYLKKESGSQVDGICVEALIQAYQKGRIKTQKER